MDLYQIFITHNRDWTERELIAFSCVFVMSLIYVIHLVHQGKCQGRQAIAGLAALTFLVIVFGSTVFTRNPTTVRKYELELFWSWKKVVYEGNEPLLKENLLNCILLLPLGVLLPWICGRKVRWWQSLLIGFIVSAGIETCQLVFCRGLFEWDDMVHNALGCMVGAVCMNLGIRKKDN